MLKEHIHNANDLDIVTQAFDTGTKTADPTDIQFDADPFLGSAVKRLYDLFIHKGIHFRDDQPRTFGGGLRGFRKIILSNFRRNPYGATSSFAKCPGLENPVIRLK